MTDLRRSLSLPLLVLYGLGVTIGAGIYVLLGATVERAGMHAPMAFVVAAVVMVFTASSFAELSARLPVSAGEAAYVRAGFGSSALSTLVGFMVIGSGVVSAAAISVGSVGYIREFIDVGSTVLIVIVIAIVGIIAAWGVVESVLFAGLFTLVEAGALIVVVGLGFADHPDLLGAVPDTVPEVSDGNAWLAVSGAGLLAFFAFIGFEDIVNLAEETRDPERNLPRAIFLTLGIATALYFLVALVAVTTVPLDELAQSRAPLTYIFEHLTGLSPAAITLIAIVATLNGVIIQIVMASRVLYGLSRQGSIPAVFSSVNAVTRTPLVATGTVIGVILFLALAFPLELLAEWTSRIVLTVFTLANASLFLIKWRGDPPGSHMTVGMWVPACGVLCCVALLVGDLLA